MDNFSNKMLDQDTLFEIFSFLEIKHMLKLQTVSKLFHKSSENENLFKQKLEKYLTKNPKKFSTNKIEINWKEEFKSKKFIFKTKKYEKNEKNPITKLLDHSGDNHIAAINFFEQYFIVNEVYTIDVAYVSSIQTFYLINHNSKFYLTQNLWGIDITNQRINYKSVPKELHELSLNTKESTEKYFHFKSLVHCQILEFIEKRFVSKDSLIYMMKFLLKFHQKRDIYDVSFQQKSKKEILKSLVTKKILFESDLKGIVEDETLSNFEIIEEDEEFKFTVFAVFLLVSTIGYVYVEYSSIEMKIDPNDFELEIKKIWEFEVDDF